MCATTSGSFYNAICPADPESGKLGAQHMVRELDPKVCATLHATERRLIRWFEGQVDMPKDESTGDAQNDLDFLRIKSQRHEIMVAPRKHPHSPYPQRFSGQHKSES